MTKGAPQQVPPSPARLRARAVVPALAIAVALADPFASPGAHDANARNANAGPPREAVKESSLRAESTRFEVGTFSAGGTVTALRREASADGRWQFTAGLARSAHLGLIRAQFGTAPTSGIPTTYHWEVRGPDVSGSCAGGAWAPVPGTDVRAGASDPLAQPTRRSFFVDVDACGVRLVVEQTNSGSPAVSHVHAYESARDVLSAGRATDSGAWPGFSAAGAIDGTYAGRWAGAPGRGRWVLRVDLSDPQPIDRLRVVLGFDATSVPRPGFGRSYAVAWAPLRYTLELAEDGEHFTSVGAEPTRRDGSPLLLRRRLVRLAKPRTVRAVRLVMEGTTGPNGTPDVRGAPVVRELAAYRGDDKRPLLAPPWVLSVNANPAGQSHFTPGGELCNDAYHAKFLQRRLASLIPALRADDRYARSLGLHGEALDAPPSAEAGEVLESIEGDDPELDGEFLSESDPPPLAILSGSNDWDYASVTGPDPAHPKRWHWNPLRDARSGGMGQLTTAVHASVAPLIGFCGGAQLLALLEARRWDGGPDEDDLRTLDRVLRRASGRPIRDFSSPLDVTRAWPSDPHPLRAKVDFAPHDRLFVDIAGSASRSSSQAFPELHADAIRSDAFLPGAPLSRFELLATSSFCSPDVVAAGPLDDVFAAPQGKGLCDTVPEAFRSRGDGWPIIGAQFHAEQRDFASAAPGDPPESTADPRLFLAAALETVLDAYVRLAP